MTLLVTERLQLSPWEAGDFEVLHGLTDSEAMRRFLDPQPSSREDSFNRLLRGAGCWALFGYGPMKLVERASGEVVGGCALFRSLRGLGEDFDPFPEAGWVVREDRWGIGYATEAMKVVLAWFDETHGGGRTVCIISPGNWASERTAEKLGYRPFGIARYKEEEVMRYARGG